MISSRSFKDEHTIASCAYLVHQNSIMLSICNPVPGFQRNEFSNNNSIWHLMILGIAQSRTWDAAQISSHAIPCEGSAAYHDTSHRVANDGIVFDMRFTSLEYMHLREGLSSTAATTFATLKLKRHRATKLMPTAIHSTSIPPWCHWIILSRRAWNLTPASAPRAMTFHKICALQCKSSVT